MSDVNIGGEGLASAPQTSPVPDGARTDASPIAVVETPEQPEQQLVFSKDKIHDELLQKVRPEDGTYSAIFPKYPRKDSEFQAMGTTNRYINLDALREISPDQYNDFKQRGLIHGEGDKRDIDVYAEWGGEDSYTKWAQEMLERSGQKLFLKIDGNAVPEAGVSANVLATQHDLWLAEERLKELQAKLDTLKSTPFPEPSPLPSVADASATATGSEVVDPATQQVQQKEQAEEARRKAQKQLEDELKQAEKDAEAAQKKVEEDEQKAKREKQKNTKITDAEALNLLNAIKTYSSQEKDLREKLKTASPEGKSDLEEQLSEVRRQKAEAMLKGIGYSEEDAAIILSRKNNLDSDLALFLRLAKHTSLSKEQNSPNIAELNRVVKVELLQSITDLLNKDKPEDQKQTWEQVRVMKVGEALRATMKALGFDGVTQDKKVKELVDSANSPERKLNVSEDDPLHTMIESLVSGKPSADVEKDAKNWFKKMEEEFRKTGEKVEDFPKWLERKINEVFHGTYNPEFAESVGLFFTMLLAEYLDVGAFMEMLLVGGDHFSSLAHDLGYKSKEQLLKEGKHPIDEHEVDAFIRKNDAKATNTRGLLCAGLEDIIPKDVVEQYLHNPSPSAVLKDEGFFKILEKAFSKEYHEKFSVNLLKALGYTEKAQENSHITLTNTAMTFIMSLPEVAKKGNWTDSGKSGGEKKAEGKGGETAARDSTEKSADQPSGAVKAEQPTASQPVSPSSPETKTV